MAFKDEVGALDGIRVALEGLAKAEGAGIPTPKATDAGKVLMVDAEGKWVLGTILPAVEAADEGKILAVDSNGKWAAESAPKELPTVADTDAGKVLTVSAAGEWEAADLPT